MSLTLTEVFVAAGPFLAGIATIHMARYYHNTGHGTARNYDPKVMHDYQSMLVVGLLMYTLGAFVL